jgi:hypothetical protein
MRYYRKFLRWVDSIIGDSKAQRKAMPERSEEKMKRIRQLKSYSE